MKFVDLDTLRVMAASSAGLTNWLLEIDIIMKCAISVASLVYIVLKCRQILNEKN